MGATSSHVMKMSRNGQISLPASARNRWKAERYLVVDLGDRVVMRPLPDDPIDALGGKYAHHPGPTTDEARRQARAEDEEIEQRRSGR